MKKREILPENRRVVTKKKKIVILAVFAVGVLALIWFKLPFEKTYTATLMLQDEGERAVYGDMVDVEIHVRVQRYFFSDPVHTGTVTVEGDVYGNPEKIVRNMNLAGAFADTSSFTLFCQEWHGDYLLIRCIATVQHGEIVNVYLRDSAGVYAGQYGQLTANVQ